jgi:hypothetical protein
MTKRYDEAQRLSALTSMTGKFTRRDVARAFENIGFSRKAATAAATSLIADEAEQDHIAPKGKGAWGVKHPKPTKKKGRHHGA